MVRSSPAQALLSRKFFTRYPGVVFLALDGVRQHFIRIVDELDDPNRIPAVAVAVRMMLL
ncbi:hypothetical protein D9M68_897740 [compost metagenome]